MTVLLLGATGNIGSRLLAALLAHKQKVVVYVRNEQKLRELIPATILSQVTIVKGEATDSSSITNALLEHGCDTVINSAGLAAVLPWSKPQLQGIIKVRTFRGLSCLFGIEWELQTCFRSKRTSAPPEPCLATPFPP